MRIQNNIVPMPQPVNGWQTLTDDQKQQWMAKLQLVDTVKQQLKTIPKKDDKLAWLLSFVEMVMRVEAAELVDPFDKAA